MYQICDNVVMATIRQMRQELAEAHSQGYSEQVRELSGIEGAPKDAVEVFILYLALEAARGRDGAADACEAMKLWARQDSSGVKKFNEVIG